MEKICEKCGWNLPATTNTGESIQVCARNSTLTPIISNSWSCGGFKYGDAPTCFRCHRPLPSDAASIVAEIDNHPALICAQCYQNLIIEELQQQVNQGGNTGASAQN